MSLLSAMRGWLAADAVPARNPLDDRWWGVGPDVSWSTQVTPETVEQIPEAYDCLLVLSQTIAALPLHIYRRAPDGSRLRLDDHPAAKLLRWQANGETNATAYEFRSQMTWDLCLHRNAYAEIVGGSGGPLSELVRIDPLCVHLVKGARRGEYVYELHDGMNRRRLTRDSMMHMRAAPFTSDGLTGKSLLVSGKRVFQRALMLEEFARRFFQNDASPGLVISLPGTFKTRDQAAEYRRNWLHQFGGANRNKPAVLDQGAKVEAFPTENNKNQFIETYLAVAQQVIRLWRMPPHKVGILDKAAFSNIEQQALEFVTDTLLPWLVAQEQAYRRDLLMPGVFPDVYCEHNVGGLLRGDLKSRYEAYAQARNWGWLSVNDIRGLENMEPVAGGDTYLQPLNMAPAGAQTAHMALMERVAPALAAELEFGG